MVNNMSPMTNIAAGYSVPTTRIHETSGEGMNYGMGGLSYSPMGYGPQAYGYAANPFWAFPTMWTGGQGCECSVPKPKIYVIKFHLAYLTSSSFWTTSSSSFWSTCPRGF